jgi:hypothetical protein
MAAGWCGAIIYFAVLFVRNLTGSSIGMIGEYVIVLFVAVIWIVAVARDERQAEPWWWPRTLGPTRSERVKGRKR